MQMEIKIFIANNIFLMVKEFSVVVGYTYREILKIEWLYEIIIPYT